MSNGVQRYHRLSVQSGGSEGPRETGRDAGAAPDLNLLRVTGPVRESRSMSETSAVVIRPRSGRALAIWRRARAVELALSGLCYDDIAAAVGFSNRGSAWRAVTEALRREVVEGVDTYRQIELARLDAILAAHWAGATSGTDLKSAGLCVKIIGQKAKLLGIDGAPRPVDEGLPRTIIVSSAPGEYARDLKAICDGSDD